MKFLLLGAAAAFLGQPVCAATLPAFSANGAIVYYNIGEGGTPWDSVGPVNLVSISDLLSPQPGLGSALASDIGATVFTSLANGGTVGAGATATHPFYGYAQAWMGWGIELVGAPSATRVPVTISGTGSGGAWISIAPGGYGAGYDGSVFQTVTPTGAFSFVANLLPNVPYAISLQANVSFGSSGLETDEFGEPVYDENGNPITLYYGAMGSASSLIDPTFTIGGPSASQYQLLSSNPAAAPVSPSPAPEPTSWAMLVCGFGIIGHTLRSRHKLQVRFA